MAHQLPLITTLASALGLALIMGFIAVRIRIPALVGYLLAGVLIGPFTPGYIADVEIAGELSEIGIMLLMFGVGLHFSLDDLLKVRKIAVPGALLQIAAATALGAGLAHLWGFSAGAALVFGLSISVASTAVLLRALVAQGQLDSMNGHITVGWVVVQDIAMVLVLVLIPPLAGLISGAAPTETQDSLWFTIEITLLKVVAFIVLMVVVGRKAFPWLLWQAARTGSREIFTLCVIAGAVTVAFLASKLFGVSFALGAFFAGMMMRESEFSHRAAEESLPLRDAFSVLFFVSVGMLFDPTVILDQPLRILLILCVIMLGTPIITALIVLAFRYPLNTALTVGGSLAQIGEFSFILAGLGVSLGLLPADGRSLILAAALISIALNPLVFKTIGPLQSWLRDKSALARRLEMPDDPLSQLPTSTDHKYLSGQVVLVGYGRVGRRISDALLAHGVPHVVAEQDRERVEQLRELGIAAVYGNASDPAVLIQAHIMHADMLVVATPDPIAARQMITTARTLNPTIEVVLRTHNEEEAQMLEQEGLGRVFLGEGELARGMLQYALDRYGKSGTR